LHGRPYALPAGLGQSPNGDAGDPQGVSLSRVKPAANTAARAFPEKPLNLLTSDVKKIIINSS